MKIIFNNFFFFSSDYLIKILKYIFFRSLQKLDWKPYQMYEFDD